jgi:DNA-binding response OmpR family regulator
MNEVPAQPVIWIVDCEQWPRALIRAELIERGYDAIGFETIKDAVTSLPWKRAPQLLILEFRGQILYGADLEPFVRLKIPMIALVSSVESYEQSFAAYPWAAVLDRPVTIGEICNEVQRLLNPDQGFDRHSLHK